LWAESEKSYGHPERRAGGGLATVHAHAHVCLDTCHVRVRRRARPDRQARRVAAAPGAAGGTRASRASRASRADRRGGRPGSRHCW